VWKTGRSVLKSNLIEQMFKNRKNREIFRGNLKKAGKKD
jgi:hypothetical protein